MSHLITITSAHKKEKRIAKSTQNHQLFLGYKKRSLKKNMIKRAKPQSMRISLPLLYKGKKVSNSHPFFLDIIPLNSCAFRTKFLHQYNTIMMMWGSLNAIWMSCTCFFFSGKKIGLTRTQKKSDWKIFMWCCPWQPASQSTENPKNILPSNFWFFFFLRNALYKIVLSNGMCNSAVLSQTHDRAISKLQQLLLWWLTLFCIRL